MAGVLQTGTFVDGQWRNESIDITTVLARNESKKPSKLPETGHVPGHGLLSQTVIESPIVHWILPINIRGFQSEDVAFISVSTTSLTYQ
jgi:hypothetical protein